MDASARSAASTAALIGLAVAVDGAAPWLQGVVARNSVSFDSSSMVLAETASYLIGGMALAASNFGMEGVSRCLSPSKYVMFLPASIAFSMSNICTYIAVREIGASQFILLAQLRIVVLALLARFWRGTRQSALEWLALAQLAIGMLVLVELRAASAHTIEPPAAATEEDRRAVETAADEAAAALAAGIAALVGVILLSAFAYIYMEGVLKANAAEAIYVQHHQLNFFGCATSLVLFLRKRMTSMDAPAVGYNNTASALAAHGLRGSGGAVPVSSPMPGSFDGWDFRMCMLLLLVVARGSMCTVILKKLDAVTKGLVDVASIIVCTALQILIDGMAVDRVTLGLQMVIMLSIMQYFSAKSSHAVADRRVLVGDAPEHINGSRPKAV